MDKNTATTIFESLSSGVRLDVFRLLVKQGQSGMVAGEIAGALGIPPNNLSFHLKAMMHAGMVAVVQEGRFLRYRANLKLSFELIDYLTAECCAGDAGQCNSINTSASCKSQTNPTLAE